MKKINLTITAFAILATMGAANAGDVKTTTTESVYTKDGDGSTRSTSTTSHTKLVVEERKTDKQIRNMLDDKIDSYTDLDDDVSFSVVDGVVILSGIVENTSERDHAGMIAEDIVGVVSVDNSIEVE